MHSVPEKKKKKTVKLDGFSTIMQTYFSASSDTRKRTMVLIYMKAKPEIKDKA